MVYGGIALADLSFFSKIRFFISFLIKTAIVFAMFAVLIPLKEKLCFSSGQLNSDGLIVFAILVLGYCLTYAIFFIISEGILKDMLIGMIISLIGGVLAAIFPPLGIVIIIIGIFSMIKQIIGVVKMIPMLLLGVLISVLLFADVLLDMYDIKVVSFVGKYILGFDKFTLVIPKIMLPYLFTTLLVSVNLAFKYNLKMALFRQTVIFLSVPIIVLVLWLIKTRIESAVFTPGQMQTASVKNGKIWVDSYTRSNGTVVSGYWRKA